MDPSLRVLFLAAEAEPFVKIGGLGDVAGSLPPALRRLSVDARLVLPLHGIIRQQGLPLRPVCEFEIPYEDGSLTVAAYSLELDGLTAYFIDGPLIPPDHPVYSGDQLADGLKFIFFSLAALRLAQELNWKPHILHANDWHTAVAVYALQQHQKDQHFFRATKSVLGVHNLPYMGSGVGELLRRFGLKPADDPRMPKWSRDMPLPLGLLAADQIVAVSPTYAREILTPQYGSGLQVFLRSRKNAITGILNGLDLESWNPETDPHLEANYSSGTLDKRISNRIALQIQLNLPVNAEAALMGMVNRMDYQKGVDLVPDALTGLPLLTREPASAWQMVILGTGDPQIEAQTRRLEIDFPGRVRVITRFDARLSRLIYGGADLMMIPSRYEPCGLTQMIAMRYGCVPLARATGGLRDTIFDYNHSQGSTGFLFEEASPESLLSALARALKVHKDRNAWKALQLRGMALDFSWDRSAFDYLNLYRSLLKENGETA
jgi:starch synthase